MTFTIRSYIAQDGERFSLLFSPGELGAPMVYPTAFISHNLRIHKTHETQKAALDAIRRLSQWELDSGISVVDRLMAGTLLTVSDVDSLAQHVRSSRHGKKGSVISSDKFNSHWIFIQKYLGWLTDILLPNADGANVRALVGDQAARLKKKALHRSGSDARRRQQILDEKLPESARVELLSIFNDPFQGLIGSTHYGTRLRNVVMIRILYETGMRRGELLSLKLKHFIEASGGQSAYLVIERNHHDEFDRRANQPVAKTLGRAVPITEALESQLLQYKAYHRAELANVSFSDEGFLFCVHTGRTEGQPLTMGGFSTAFGNFLEYFPILSKALHPHALRHDWNYRFSQHADRLGMSEEEEIEAREESMGWVPDSSMAKVYNLRHRREKAMAIGRVVARDTERPAK